jgi:hypothetical protein
MKPQLVLEMPIETQEVQLICHCCGQPYHPDKSWEDCLQAVVFGAEKYAICPLCTQAVPDDVFRDDGYRRRCHYEVARLQSLYELERKSRPKSSDTNAERATV